MSVKSPFFQGVIYPDGPGFTGCNIFRRALSHLLSPLFSNAYSTSHLCAMKVIVCLVVEWEMFCRKAFRNSGWYCIKKDSAEEIFPDKWILHTAVRWASSVCVLHASFTFHFYVVLHKMHGHTFATFHHEKNRKECEWIIKVYICVADDHKRKT